MSRVECRRHEGRDGGISGWRLMGGVARDHGDADGTIGYGAAGNSEAEEGQ